MTKAIIMSNCNVKGTSIPLVTLISKVLISELMIIFKISLHFGMRSVKLLIFPVIHYLSAIPIQIIGVNKIPWFSGTEVVNSFWMTAAPAAHFNSKQNLGTLLHWDTNGLDICIKTVLKLVNIHVIFYLFSYLQ